MRFHCIAGFQGRLSALCGVVRADARQAESLDEPGVYAYSIEDCRAFAHGELIEDDFPLLEPGDFMDMKIDLENREVLFLPNGDADGLKPKALQDDGPLYPFVAFYRAEDCLRIEEL